MKNKYKKILVTGTSSGIGKSIALKLLKHNFTVIGISRTHTIKNSKYTRSLINYFLFRDLLN